MPRLKPPPEPKQSDPGLDPQQSAAAAMAAILTSCAGDFERHRARLMHDPDPEGPHGARVALRRLRTALAAFRPILRQSVARPLAAEARALFRTLGALRDADVLAGEIAEGAEARRLTGEADAVRARVREDLDKADAAGFAGRVAAAVAGDGWMRRKRRRRRTAAAPVAGFAPVALGRAWAQVGSHGKHLPDMADDERHGFRKDLKALRYLADFFGPLFPGKAQARFLGRLKRLQDALGTLNDLAVAEGRLGSKGKGRRRRAAAAAMKAAETEWTALRKGRLWW